MYLFACSNETFYRFIKTIQHDIKDLTPMRYAVICDTVHIPTRLKFVLRNARDSRGSQRYSMLH